MNRKEYAFEVSEILAIMGYSHIATNEAFDKTCEAFRTAGKTTEECAKTVAKIFRILGYTKRNGQ